MLEKILSLIEEDTQVARLAESLLSLPKGQPLEVTRVSGSLVSIMLVVMSRAAGRQQLMIARDRESAAKVQDDLNVLMPGRCVYFSGIPESLARGQDTNVQDHEAIHALLSKPVPIVITHADAVSSGLPEPQRIKDQAIKVAVGDELDLEATLKRLLSNRFSRVDFVSKPGEYANRGGILDVFPYVGENPIRIELSGDRVESVREFDPLSQRSVRELSVGSIVPDLLSDSAQGQSPVSTLFEYLHPDAVVIVEEPEVVSRVVLGREGGTELLQTLVSFPHVTMRGLSAPNVEAIDIGSVPQPSFNGSIRRLQLELLRLQSQGFRIVFTCDSQSERLRLQTLLEELDGSEDSQDRVEGGSLGVADLEIPRIDFMLRALHEGFALPGSKLAVYTEHQVFGRLKRRGRKRRTRLRGLSEREAYQLRKGDFVVHVDFGIGRFEGLEKIRVRDVEQEVLKLRYEGDDSLYVNLNYLNRVQRYSSREGHVPKLSRLGGSEWGRLQSSARGRIKDIARDLIHLYARRKTEQGFMFEKDTPWQKELEASFMYEDTYDQARSALEVKQDMEAFYPMDRLVCGDVGFGKTEVAVRAAFKAVLSGKQVAVLVPTTILAVQHYRTFVDRTARYSTNVEVISRLRSKKEQAEIVAGLKAGSIDILIGTHRLLSKDVVFKDLGLLVIDEEHRFGVAAKEKLRQLKAAVDTLTLTATPIPRTLQFSLIGARDLSIIATPPRNRVPIVTEITQYDEALIKESVFAEVQRGGQVYFVHDRIERINEVADHLRAILPGVRVDIAHGQMRAHDLEDVMLEFLEKKIDVLVCTKIIESGLDIPNVNTIIINRADRFGMAELYQLRGRVGRSNREAYAYLLIPPIDQLSREAMFRLQAIEQFSELGSGLNLAMRDLEIRGAGNLLGGEQSGFIDAMGFEMYNRVLQEAVRELKEQEFQQMLPEVSRFSRCDTVVEVDVEALLPDVYVESDAERLTIYRRLYSVSSVEQLAEIVHELEDRFGRLPVPVRNLVEVVKIRLAAARLGVTKVAVARGTVEIHFPPEAERGFYESEEFREMVMRISVMKEFNVVLKHSGGNLTLLASLGNMPGNAELLAEAARLLSCLTSGPRVLPDDRRANSPG